MSTPKIKNTAILIGFDPEGGCVYSEILDLSDYYDGEHLWDKSARVKRLKLERVKGYLFKSDGTLVQEFESVFDLNTGITRMVVLGSQMARNEKIEHVQSRVSCQLIFIRSRSKII